MPLLESTKKLLRIGATNTTFDEEVSDLITAAQNDLRLAGVLKTKTEDEADPLIKRTVSIYVKANFGFDNPDAKRLMESYEALKAHLTLSQEYNSFTITFTVKVGTVLLENATVTFNDQEQITNSAGTAIFIGVKQEQNMKYRVILGGYVALNGIVDIELSRTVAVFMTAVV
jgi:hypothetical protein